MGDQNSSRVWLRVAGACAEGRAGHRDDQLPRGAPRAASKPAFPLCSRHKKQCVSHERKVAQDTLPSVSTVCAVLALARSATPAGPHAEHLEGPGWGSGSLLHVGSARQAAPQVSVKDQLAKMLVHGPDVGIECVGATLALTVKELLSSYVKLMACMSSWSWPFPGSPCSAAQTLASCNDSNMHMHVVKACTCGATNGWP